MSIKAMRFFLSLLSFALSACLSPLTPSGSGSEECRYYDSAKKGGAGLSIGSVNQAVQQIQKEISERCAPEGRVSLNAAQCRDQLLENFKRRDNCA